MITPLLAATVLGLVAALSPKSAWIAPSHWKEGDPCPVLRKAFVLNDTPKKAVVRVIGLGHYVLHVNGKRVGSTLLNQAWSQYDKTLYWQEFDLTKLLKSGENVIGIMLGDSFWSVRTPNDPNRFSKTDAMPNFSAGEPFLTWIDGRVELDNGSTVDLNTDESWSWSPGPLTFSHIYAGEDFDARLETKGWDKPGYDAKGWQPVRIAPVPKAQLVELPSSGIRAFDTFKPTQILEPEPGIFTYVFPQNCNALLRFTVRGPNGSRIRFKPCEYLDSKGKVKFTYTWGTGKDIWIDYTLKGGASESYQVMFASEGGQFVEVTGAVPSGRPNPKNLPVVESLELVSIRTANEAVGSFECSSPMQNAAHKLIDWSIQSNMSHVATDCPHREKNGWQEQNWHMARGVSYRYDDQNWLHKIMHDVRDTQLPDGHVPTNCPNYLVGIPPHGFWNEAPEWGISSVLVQWHLYEWYGDREALSASFESMKRYVDYLSTQAKDGVITSNLGDWYDFGHGKGDGPSQWTPAEVSATMTWAYGAKTVTQAAKVLGKSAEEAKYAGLYDSIRATFLAKFYDPITATAKNNGSCQAGTSMALCVGLIPDADRPRSVQAIVADLEKRGYQQTTGEVLHVFLVRALSEAGRSDVLHKVYAREDRGSYGFMVKSGLTTLPESWDAKPGTGNSLNHFMLGHLIEWHFAYVAGIRQAPGSVGWKKILIAPTPGQMEWAKASFNSPSGKITVSWKNTRDGFVLEAGIPKGIEATAVLPDGTPHPLKAGRNTVRQDNPSDRS